MHSLEGTVAANTDAVLREYQQAVDDNNVGLGLRILRANPDLFVGSEDWPVGYFLQTVAERRIHNGPPQQEST